MMTVGSANATTIYYLHGSQNPLSTHSGSQAGIVAIHATQCSEELTLTIVIQAHGKRHHVKVLLSSRCRSASARLILRCDSEGSARACLQRM